MPSSIENPSQAPAVDVEVASASALVPAPFDSAAATVSRAVRLYAANFPQVALLVAVVIGPVELFEAWFETTANAAPATAMRFTLLVDAILSAFVSPAILFSVVETSRTGRAPTLGQSLGYGVKRWGETLGANLVAGILTGLGLLLLIVPGIVFAIRYSFRSEIVALARPGFKRPLQRSAELAKGREWRLLGAYCLAFLIMFGVGIAAGVAQVASEHWLVVGLGGVAVQLTMPIVLLTGLLAYLGLAHDGAGEEWMKTLRWRPADAPASDVQPAVAPAS